MKNREVVAPIAAVVTALTTLICCLPLGFATAAATASLSVIVSRYQLGLLATSAALLFVGVLELRRAYRTCATHRRASTIVFCISATIVVLVILFPQTIAGIAADWMP